MDYGPSVVSFGVPIPAFDEYGALPVGIHDCMPSELRERFGSFQSSDRRPLLYARLEQFVRELRRFRSGLVLLINGSFVTTQPRPNDIDLILILPIDWDLRAELPPDAYNLLSKTRVKRFWGFDILVARAETTEYFKYVEFFQRVRYSKTRRKGIVRITL